MKKGSYVKSKIENLGYNVRSFSEEIGLPYTTIRSLLERNFKKASIENVSKICNALNIPISKFASEDDNIVESEEVSKADIIEIPYFRNSDRKDKNVFIPKVMVKDHLDNIDQLFALDCKNDSMNKLIKKDSLVIMQKVAPDEIKSEDVVSVVVDGNTELRRIYLFDEHMILKNESTDPSYYDVAYTLNRNIGLTGKVVAFTTSEL